MSKRLILVRHAKSSWEFPEPDHDRSLNGRGQLSAQAIGRWLRELGVQPDQVLCSSATRTQQTYAHLGFSIAPQILTDLYHASPDAIYDALCEARGTSVLVLAHNPGIAAFAAHIVAVPPAHPRFHDYPTCATAVIDFEIDDWSDLKPQTGKVLDFVIPRELLKT